MIPVESSLILILILSSEVKDALFQNNYLIDD